MEGLVMGTVPVFSFFGYYIKTIIVGSGWFSQSQSCMCSLSLESVGPLLCMW